MAIELPRVAIEFQLAWLLVSPRNYGGVERRNLIKPGGNACVLQFELPSAPGGTGA